MSPSTKPSTVPWTQIRDEGPGCTRFILDGDGLMIAEVFLPPSPQGGPTLCMAGACEANADLLASGPALSTCLAKLAGAVQAHLADLSDEQKLYPIWASLGVAHDQAMALLSGKAEPHA